MAREGHGVSTLVPEDAFLHRSMVQYHFQFSRLKFSRILSKSGRSARKRARAFLSRVAVPFILKDFLLSLGKSGSILFLTTHITINTSYIRADIELSTKIRCSNRENAHSKLNTQAAAMTNVRDPQPLFYTHDHGNHETKPCFSPHLDLGFPKEKQVLGSRLRQPEGVEVLRVGLRPVRPTQPGVFSKGRTADIFSTCGFCYQMIVTRFGVEGTKHLPPFSGLSSAVCACNHR